MNFSRAPLRAASAALATLVLATAIAGCAASTRSRADAAFERGDFSSAAALYASVVASDPSDGTAKARLAEARTHVLEDLSLDVNRARAANATDDAMTKLERFLTTARSWGTSGSDATAQRAKEQVTWADLEVRGAVDRFVKGRMPLSAEGYLSAHGGLLRQPELAPTLRAVSPQIVSVGREVCSTAATRIHPDTPYYSRVAARLCRHFGGVVSLEPPLPFVVSGVQLAGGAEGVSAEDRTGLLAAVQRGLQASPFWDASAGRTATVTLSGHNRAGFDRQPRTITRPWVETVPYQAMETYDEPYTEYYPDTENYSEEVPYTDYEQRTRPCGNTICTDSVPVTKYRSEQRTRTVTRQRTAYRQRQRMVTRYRDENRIFTFEALEVSGSYDVDLGLAVQVAGGLPPYTIHFAAAETQRGLEHDTSFPPAGVSPSHVELPSASAWLADRMPKLAEESTGTSRVAWGQYFCTRASFGLEDAARCAYGSPSSLPPAARVALAEAIGPDVEPILALEQ